ncbi:MAG TPA: HAD family hydrolase [Gaiellaceae bacterium]|nr:HAD family hydrolase [Gaiellaceae bacterium]
MAAAVLLDVDGTLVDTNYHHALAWYRAFREEGIMLPVWRIHRHVGMGGDQLVPALVPGIDRELHEAIETAREKRYAELLDEVAPFDEAHELIVDLKRSGVTVVLASSSPQDELDHYLELLDAQDVADSWTTKDDVDATKPEPDLVVAALEKAGAADAVLVGDTAWDVEAARKAGLHTTICVMTGGWAKQELLDAGAAVVYESLAELRQNLERPPLSLS